MQDARPVAFALLVSSLVLGCQTSGKTIPAKQPVPIHTPAPKPASATMNTTKSRDPIVNGEAVTTPAVLPVIPGVSQSPIGVPTIPNATPVSIAPLTPSVVSRSEGYLPVMPPMSPDATSPPMIPVSSPIAAPADLK